MKKIQFLSSLYQQLNLVYFLKMFFRVVEILKTFARLYTCLIFSRLIRRMLVIELRKKN